MSLYKRKYNPVPNTSLFPTATIVTFKPGVANAAALPLSGNTLNDGRITADNGHLYVWDGSIWIDQGDIVDLKWAAIEDKPTSSVSNIDDAVSKKHSNSLDHTQGTDQGLDTGGTNAVTAAQAKAGYSHSQVAHAPSDAVSLATVKADTDIDNAIDNAHAPHSDDQDLSGLQPLDLDLSAIADLGFTTAAFLKKTGIDTWSLDTNSYLTSFTETDPLSLHLDQSIPQTFTNLGGGTGLLKITAGLLGLDTNTYVTGTPWVGLYLPIGGGTLTGNLLFTDASFDIGANGATRPRDLFLSRNAKIGGTLGAGAITGTSLDAGSGLIQTTGDVQIGDDLLLNSASIINWNSEDITLTHSTNTLTFAGMSTFDLGTATLITDFINLKTLTTPLHITKNQASAEPTWNTANDILVIENSTSTSLQLLCAVGGVCNLGFSTTATRINGLIQYNHATDSMFFNTALTTRLTLAPTLATFTTDVNIDDDLIVDDDCDIVGDLTAGTIQADNGQTAIIPGPEVGKQMVFVKGILVSYEAS